LIDIQNNYLDFPLLVLENPCSSHFL